MSRGENVVHFLRYLAGLDEARTQTTVDERALLRRCAADASAIVELGAFEGVSGREMRSAMPGGAELFSIDPFIGNALGQSLQLVICKREIGKVSNGRWTLRRGFSQEVAADWRTPIDLLFMDGDHSVEGCRRDFLEWSEFVRPGGTILVHTSEENPVKPVPRSCGPYRLVHEVVAMDPRFVLRGAVDSITIVEKR